MAAGLALCCLSAGPEIWREHALPAQEDLRPVVEYLRREEQPGDRIFVTPGAVLAFRYYSRRSPRAWIAATANDGYYEGRTLVLTLQTGIRYANELRQELARPGRLWMVASHLYPGEPTLDEVLDSIGGERRPKLVLKPNGSALYLTE